MANDFRSARFWAQEMIEAALYEGAVAVDATMGNGHDTLFLCELVGEEGKVIAFDVQAQAVESTRRRLMENGMLGRASLYHMGHERMEEAGAQDVSAIVFNLGWLPGGDKNVTTLWETTKVALEKALSLLKKNGVLLLCAYPGHQEGDRERAEVINFLASLPPQQYNVLHQRFLNAGPGAPENFVIQRQ